ncbi:MAG: PEP-CTERM sorting domain-containing protein, partial [Planctomycetales bacterium]|nr:PEP-CTERM sorting domain-containing protein [Planctomycetales bacterium]
VAGFQDEAKTIPSRSFLSYEYDSASGSFVVQARQLTAIDDFNNSANVFGDVLSLTDTDFYFAFVDFAHPFSPPGTGGGEPGDFDQDGSLTAVDIDLLNAAIRQNTNVDIYDLNNDQALTEADRLVWVEELANTYVGDSNLDGVFDSSDFVFVFQKGEYEDGVANNSTWATGDWNGDTEFDSSDFVAAFQRGGYEAGARAAVAAVPEPSTAVMAALAMLLVGARRRS